KVAGHQPPLPAIMVIFRSAHKRTMAPFVVITNEFSSFCYKYDIMGLYSVVQRERRTAVPPYSNETLSQRKQEPQLVDLKKLKALMEGLELSDKKLNEYINARWLKYVEWWDSRAAKAKWKYFALRSTVVIGGALIPALVALRELKQFENAAW